MTDSSMERPARRRWRATVALLPGVALTMLHSSILDLVKVDVIQAIDSDKYRFQWVVGCYLVGGASGMAMTRFIGGRVGLRNVYLAALLLFSFTSAVCGVAREVLWMAPFRLAQGFGMGLVVATAMTILWREFPLRKGLAMAIYAVGLYLSVAIGPALGGFLTSAMGWRVLFLGNLPAGLLLFSLALALLEPDPPGEDTPAPFDLVGYLLLVGWIIPLVVMVDMGQYWGWTNSPYFVPWFAIFVIAAILFIAWGLFASAPLINLHPFRVRNFALGIAVKVIFSINLYVQLSLLGAYMTDLRGYQWWEGGLVLICGAGAMLLSMAVGLFWTGHRTRKIRMAGGLLGMAAATWQLASVDLYTSKIWIASIVFAWALAAGIVVVPALLTIFEDLSPVQVFRSAGVFNIMRSIPAFTAGTLGVALFTQTADGNFDLWRLDITHHRPIVKETSKRLEQHFRERGVSLQTSRKQSRAALGQWVHAHGKAYAFGTLFGYLALLTLLGPLAVLFVRTPQPDLPPPREQLRLAFGNA